jgi:Domain of unknown function (DUF4129)
MIHARVKPGVVVLLWLLVVGAASLEASDWPLSVPEYIARLDALASALGGDVDESARVAVLVDALPGILRVDGSPRVFEIPTDSIRRDFRAWQKDHDASARRRLLHHLHTLRSEAARFEKPAVSFSAPRALLAGILDAKEFRSVHGPTWTDRLRQRAFELLVRVLSVLFRESAIPTVANVLVYGLIAAAVLALALATYRFIRRSAAAETILPRQPMASPMDWPLWLAEAQSAAARGKWRDAIHFTYWCAVAFLEGKGAWRPDRARTPREYLRLLPPSSDDRATLAALTRRFELVWYGNANADAEAFAESVENLKKMGCPAT